MIEIEKQDLTRVENSDIQTKGMSTVQTRPNSMGLYGSKALTPEDLKKQMDSLALLALGKINAIIDGMQAGGDVANTIKFKKDEDEYSLAELFAMIFPKNASDVMLSNILKTNVEGTTESGTRILLSLNDALANILYSLQTEYATSLTASFDDTETYMLCIRLLNKNGKDLLNNFKIDMKVNSGRIIDKAITTDKLADSAVTTSKLKDAVVSTSKLADNSVTEAKLDSNVSDKLNSAFKSVSYNSENGYLTFTDSNGTNVTIDLPLELIVDHGGLDKTENAEKIILYLANGKTIEIPIKDFVDKFDDRFLSLENNMGNIDTALTKIKDDQKAIIAMQEELIGGESV